MFTAGRVITPKDRRGYESIMKLKLNLYSHCRKLKLVLKNRQISATARCKHVQMASKRKNIIQKNLKIKINPAKEEY